MTTSVAPVQEQRLPRVRRPAQVFGIVTVALVSAIVLLLPLLVRGDPLTQDLARSLSAPGGEHLLGTDQYGRDVALRLAHGAANSYTCALVVVFSATIIGLVVGIIAAGAAGPLRWSADRLIDVFLGLPGIVIALALVGVLGPGQGSLIIAMTVGVWPWYARLVREHTATLLGMPFIDAARISGVSTSALWMGHVVPHVLRRLLIIAALDVGYTIVAFAGLSYLGLGIQQPAPDLGGMLRDGQDYFLNAPWLLIGPTLMIALIILPFVIAGERTHNRGLGL